MVAFTTTSAVVRRMHEARSVALCAYVLRPGRVLRALEAAARSGARVTVRLEGRPYADKDGSLARLNRRAIARLRAFGANAQLVDRAGKRPNHMKAAVIDDAAFLDDRNWPFAGGNTVIEDDDARDVDAARDAIRGRPADGGGSLTTTKAAALRQEAEILARAVQTRSAVCVESESLNAGNPTYSVVKTLASAGVCVRLLVSRRDLKPNTGAALVALRRAGVAIRIGESAEKLAVAGRQAWIGSANATYGKEDQIDWGLRIGGHDVRAALKARFESNWKRARPFSPRAD